MKTYQAPWGRSLIVISGLLVVIAIASAAGLPILLANVPRDIAVPARWLLPVIVLCFLPFMIRGYAITGDAILIQRLLWTTRLDRGALKSAEVSPDAMRRSLRVFGNGGGFSFTGWYWSKSLGFYRAYATDLNRAVVLRFVTRIIVVTPADPADFVEELTR